uniref:Uncharacterized protein n=1 Tax=Anas platyrhynchos platyrhynchos TaxID=8840 RepID=A0A493T643_ANAPP
MAAGGPGAAGAARVSSGRELGCVPEVAAALGAVARQGSGSAPPGTGPGRRRDRICCSTAGVSGEGDRGVIESLEGL